MVCAIKISGVIGGATALGLTTAKITVGRVSIPITLALGMAIHGESSHISSFQKTLYQGLLNFYQSGYTGGLYYIKIHSANMWNPFSEQVSHSLYYSNGNYLTGYHHGAFFGF